MTRASPTQQMQTTATTRPTPTLPTFTSNNMYWNYSPPANYSNSSIWQTKIGTAATENDTLPADCANQSIIQLRIMANNSNATTQYSAAATTATWNNGTANSAYTNWTAPTNAQSYNSVATTAAISAPASKWTRALNGTGWGFSIPANATITGVVVNVRVNVSSTSSGRVTQDWNVSLEKAGVPAGKNLSSTTAYTTSYVNYTYGGINNLSTTWNVSLTPDDVNNTNFGFLYSSYNSSGSSSRTVAVDYINMTVYYNETANYSQSTRYCYNGVGWKA